MNLIRKISIGRDYKNEASCPVDDDRLFRREVLYQTNNRELAQKPRTTHEKQSQQPENGKHGEARLQRGNAIFNNFAAV